MTPDGSDRWLLTCRHVLARADGSIVAADRILQPALANGTIATLATVVSDSALDCAAVPLAIPVSSEVLGIGGLAHAIPPVPMMRVMKSGWKTGVSEGRIQAVVGTDVIIERFPDYPADYLLAAEGDSGAIWVEATTLAPVALHRREPAVGPHLAIATDFSAVLAALQLQQI